MTKHTINDFEVGDEVFHRSNPIMIMIVVEIDKEGNEISCRWMDTKGITHIEEFLPQELGKHSPDPTGGLYLG
jgi:uncharacterized protein YodC (DUF2158 family)